MPGARWRGGGPPERATRIHIGYPRSHHGKIGVFLAATTAASAEAKAEAVEESLRGRLRAASELPDVAAKVLLTFERAMEATKRVRLSEPCARCGCQHHRWVDVPDAVAAATAAKIFAEHVEGRLGSAVPAESSVVVRRVGPRVNESVVSSEGGSA